MAARRRRDDVRPTQLAEKAGLNLRVVKLVSLILSLLFVTHLLGCGWRLLAGSEWGLAGGTWLSEYALHTALHAPSGSDAGPAPLGGDTDSGRPMLLDEYVQCLLLSLSVLL